MFKHLKRLLCGHHYFFVRNIHGDEINLMNGNRSWWKCGLRGKEKALPLYLPSMTTGIEDQKGEKNG